MKKINKHSWYIRIWEGERYLDIWSLNHFLSGFVLSGFFMFIDLSLWVAFILSFIIMLSWEIYERTNNFLMEQSGNQVLDIITGLAGFFIMYYLIMSGKFENSTLFIITLVSFLILETWGFIALKIIKKK